MLEDNSLKRRINCFQNIHFLSVIFQLHFTMPLNLPGMKRVSRIRFYQISPIEGRSRCNLNLLILPP